MSNQKSHDRVLNKIKKMLAMGERSEGNEHEAQVAMEMAYKLMAKHNIDRAEIMDDDDVESFGKECFTRKRGGPWARDICFAIARLYFCKYYYSGGKNRTDTHHFIGTDSNVAIAQMVSNFVMDIIDNEAKRTAIATLTESKTQYLNSFRNTAGKRIASRATAMIAEAERGEATDESGCKMLVLASVYQQHRQGAEDFLEGEGIRPQARAVRSRSTSSRGASAGHAAGNRVNLRPSIT